MTRLGCCAVLVKAVVTDHIHLLVEEIQKNWWREIPGTHPLGLYSLWFRWEQVRYLLRGGELDIIMRTMGHFGSP